MQTLDLPIAIEKLNKVSLALMKGEPAGALAR